MFWQDYWWIILLVILGLPVVAIAGFGFWMRSKAAGDLEVGAKCWDIFVKLVSALTIVVAGAMAFGKYIDQREVEERRNAAFQKAEVHRKKLEFDIKAHEQKVLLLKEAARTAARIANSDSPTSKDIIRFDGLYFADLIGVEIPKGEVESAMVCFRAKQRNPASIRTGCPNHELPTLALDLSKAVKSELLQSQEAILEQQKVISEYLTSDDGR